jgi:hypothetical protein
MLFLAVTLGFFVENQREHFVEKQREKKFAALLLNDLKEDTSAYKYVGSIIKKANGFYDSARQAFQHQPGMTDDAFVRLARDLYTPFNLITRATTFNQMKNSGSLRYIKNTELAAELSYYYDQRIPQLQTFFQYVNEKLHTQIEPFFAQHFDLTLTSSYYYYDSLPAHLKYYGRSETSDLLIKNYFQLYFNGIDYIGSVAIKATNERAILLIEQLQKEYNLK